MKKSKNTKIKEQVTGFAERTEDNSGKKTAKQVTSVQLNLFSWQTEQLARGWQYLAGLNFDEAKKIFLTVLHQDAGDEEAILALRIISYWKENFEKCSKMEDPGKVPFLFSELESFLFPKAWGPKLFRDALLQKIISIAQKTGAFHINNNLTIADLYLMADKPEYAELEILKYTEINEASASVLSRLADIQWILGKFPEAGQNYLKALLVNPGEIRPEKTENKTLAAIIKKYGTEMAPAWGWIYSQLPLTEFKENESCEITKRGLYACYLLSMAEKSMKQNNVKQMVDFRKLLKEKEPELFDAYFEQLRKRKL